MGQLWMGFLAAVKRFISFSPLSKLTAARAHRASAGAGATTVGPCKDRAALRSGHPFTTA